MYLVNRFFFFIATLVFCISYANAHENKYVFVGQNGNETSFVLEIMSDDMNNIAITENGEVWLRADKIIAIPKDQLAQSSDHDKSISEIYAAAPLSYSQFLNNLLPSKDQRAEELEVRCPMCRFYYVPRPPTWSCPRCN